VILEVGQVYLVNYRANPRRIDPYLVYEERGVGLFGVIRLTDMFVTYTHQGDWTEKSFPYQAVERLF
jgi:hypothetical protein